MKRILVDIDTQFDFIDPAGALYVPAPAEVRAAIVGELARAVDEGVPVVGSVDSHAWDAWEFAQNGGPFPPHCVKGTPGWLRIAPDLPSRSRFIPMQESAGGEVRNLVGESKQGAGNRVLGAAALAQEACDGVGLYFEKEVYSLFLNPTAEVVLDALVERLGGRSDVRFDVIGYCTGGYCVDAAVRGLLERGYAVTVLAYATAPIGGDAGAERSSRELRALGATWAG